MIGLQVDDMRQACGLKMGAAYQSGAASLQKFCCERMRAGDQTRACLGGAAGEQGAVITDKRKKQILQARLLHQL